jgi:hypothetical protein
MGQTQGDITQNLAERLCWQPVPRCPDISAKPIVKPELAYPGVGVQ